MTDYQSWSRTPMHVLTVHLLLSNSVQYLLLNNSEWLVLFVWPGCAIKQLMWFLGWVVRQWTWAPKVRWVAMSSCCQSNTLQRDLSQMTKIPHLKARHAAGQRYDPGCLTNSGCLFGHFDRLQNLLIWCLTIQSSQCPNVWLLSWITCSPLSRSTKLICVRCNLGLTVG